MSYNPIWGTGFEMGAIPAPSADIHIAAGSVLEVSSGYAGAHTGTYFLFIDGSAYMRVEVGGSQGELYQGLWVYPNDNDETARIQFVLSSGHIIELKYRNANNTWDAYVNGSNIASGSIETSGWHHVQFYLLAANSGQIITKIDGTEDINYEGDTTPGVSNTIEYARVQNTGISATRFFIDDWTFGDDGWPGDMRFDPILAVGDTPTEEWDLSAGADSWDLLDEVPPSDSDYIFSTVNGEQTIVELDAWDAVDKLPQFVMLWARAKKDVADAHQIQIIKSDGVNTRVGDAQDLLTSYSYVYELLRSSPDGFQWDDTKVDNLNAGVQSVVV